VRRFFFQKEIAPHAKSLGARQGFVDRWAFTKAASQGYLLMWADEKYGGAGVADFRYEQIVYEENMQYGEPGFYVQLHSGPGRSLHRQAGQRRAEGEMASGLRSRRKRSWRSP